MSILPRLDPHAQFSARSPNLLRLREEAERNARLDAEQYARDCARLAQFGIAGLALVVVACTLLSM